MSTGKTSPALLALTGALAALPGYAEQDADTGYRYSFYKEADLSAGHSASGQAQSRYEIHSHQLEHSQSLNQNWQLDVELMVETMSGASPWFVLPDNQGGAVQVMSGASISENRQVLSVGATHDDAGDMRWSGRLGVSDEDDYRALSGGLQWEFDQNQRSRTWSAGLGLSKDKLEPTDGGNDRFPDRIVRADKDSVQAVVGVSQILNRQTIAQLSLAYSRDSGFLSDPYKLVFVDGNNRPDSRPDQRNKWALTTRMRHYWKALGTTLQLSWRHFEDNWDIRSDTVELGALGRIKQRWRWSSRLRWYQQSQADFYGPYFNQAPASSLHSSDYRLSPYGAVSLRLGVDYFSQRWSLGLAWEHYDSDGRYAPGSVNLENPGLVDFDILSVAFAWHFGQASAARSGLQPPTDDLEVIAPQQNNER